VHDLESRERESYRKKRNGLVRLSLPVNWIGSKSSFSITGISLKNDAKSWLMNSVSTNPRSRSGF
ncbi:hypothetical protein TELCIR_25772, partial [Teladorsagia circumcincta]